MEVYIDDVAVKTTVEDNLITDIAQTFDNCCRYCWKLNPEKCVFSVPSGKLLGFMVIHRGIEVNPTKVNTIRKMKRPIEKKDVIKLTGMMAAQGRFISKLRENVLPFVKLLKKSNKDRYTGREDVSFSSPSLGDSRATQKPPPTSRKPSFGGRRHWRRW
jgi:hypothetical protein